MHYIQGDMTHDEDVLTALNACNIAIRAQPIQYVSSRQRWLFSSLIVFIRDNPFNTRSFFTRTESSNLGKGLELWRGYFQSIRPSIGRMIVNVDISSAAFFKEGPLIRLCLEFLGIPINANPDLHLRPNMNARSKNTLLKFIRNLEVRTERGADVRIRSIKDFSDVSADDFLFPHEGAQISISVCILALSSHLFVIWLRWSSRIST